jgi:protein-tyrosine phosphatase
MAVNTCGVFLLILASCYINVLPVEGWRMEPDCSEIIPGRLWVGQYIREDEIEKLKGMGITAVVSLQTDTDLARCGVSPDTLAEAYERAGIDYRRVPTTDFDRSALERNLPEAVAEVAAILSHPAARLYLHCTAGISRSTTTAAAYLIRLRGMMAWEACDYLQSRRDCDPALEILERFEAAARETSC